MKIISRLFLFGALALGLLTAACAGQQASPTPQATATTVATDTPTVAATDTATMTPTTTVTAGIPVTGPLASMLCQFCLDAAAHAVVVMPAGATFTLLTPTATVSSTTSVSPTCNTVETLNDKQVVLCLGQSNTSIALNVCADNNCQQVLLRLQTCPPPTLNPATLTPTVTLTATASRTPIASPTTTPTGAASPTVPAATSTPAASPTASTATPTASPTFTPTP